MVMWCMQLHCLAPYGCMHCIETQCMQVQGHSKVGHISADMSHPCHHHGHQ